MMYAYGFIFKNGTSNILRNTHKTVAELLIYLKSQEWSVMYQESSSDWSNRKSGNEYSFNAVLIQLSEVSTIEFVSSEIDLNNKEE